MESQEKKHIHPITRIISEVTSIFVDMGFEVAQGPELEKEYYNFDALNVAQDHPSRDMQDTFWLEPLSLKKLMRTHTSGVQARFMENYTKEGNKPPFSIVVPGRVFRNEATDATHDAQFYQMEGLMIGKDISLAHLKTALHTFLKKLFGEDVIIRMRPGYFPFVEPGVEIDMICFKCRGEGCPSCSHSGWIEILGAGMVHPKVLNNVGIDSREYQGFAFGVGIDRIAMLKYGIDDIRLLYSGDLRLNEQF